MIEVPATKIQWSLLHRILFRLFAIYFTFYVFTGIYDLLGWLMEEPVTWAGKLLIAKDYTITVRTNGSGDTTYNYLFIFCHAVLSLLLCIIWSIADWKRSNYNRLRYWLMLLIRFGLAYSMMFYGFYKILKVQFPDARLWQMDQPFGMTSPMGLAWRFMGYSAGFNYFTGFGEFFGGLFLFFRRTKLFGALLSIVVLSNIVALNLCYDIPVKLFSIHLLLMAVFICYPDFIRLIKFFFLNKPVPADNSYHPHYKRRWMRILHPIVKYVIVLLLIGYTFYVPYYTQQSINPTATRPSFYGSYDVKSRIHSNQDSIPWKTVYIERKNMLACMNDSNKFKYYEITIDSVHRKITGENMMGSTDTTRKDKLELSYIADGPKLRLLEGTAGNDTIRLELNKRDLNMYRLINRGFHWINEFPYNR
ncbi:MAG TPA: hypothetical protein VM802_10310 [Chitinophaga sp.]|uniref:hypothetical protein n=1 Tax=Chitinophaga sp. TaxID=1869181 RepID=UPI002C08D742|nr:hypothetical protein [Chitinophaga sp.]HVI45255.1 hypothetical protein [Chitinophaga sp.]